MTIEISAKIDGYFDFISPTDEVWFNKRRCLLYKEDGCCYIAFRIDVRNPTEYYPKDFYDLSDIFTEFEKHNLYNEAIDLFKYVESIGAYNFNVEKIYWEQPRIKFMPQTDDENVKYPFFQESKIKVSNSRKTIVSRNGLSEIILYRKQYEKYNLPLSFYREGDLAFRKVENRKAFLMYYMMLELLFAQDETAHSRTKINFAQSDILTKAISSTLAILALPDFNEHLLWLQRKCKKYNQNVDVIGFHHILIQMRGELAHGLQKSSAYIFNDKELYTLSLLTGCIAKYVCGLLIINSFRTPPVK